MAKTCGLCGYAAKDDADFDEHMHSQHNWGAVVQRGEKRLLRPLAAIPLFLLWFVGGIPLLLPIVLRQKDRGFDLRKADHTIAALMVPSLALSWYLQVTIGPLVLRRANDYQIDSFSRAFEIIAVNLAFLTAVGLARVIRLALAR